MKYEVRTALHWFGLLIFGGTWQVRSIRYEVRTALHWFGLLIFGGTWQVRSIKYEVRTALHWFGLLIFGVIVIVNQKTFAMQDFKQRTFQFAVSVVKLIRDLPYDLVNRAYLSQLVRSSSSIGANYRAAKRGKSDADFINKLKIAEEEADESVYFLELLFEFNPDFKEKITGLVQEGTEILKIIVSSITTTRARIANTETK